MRQMLLHASTLLNPPSGDVKPFSTEALPVTNNVRKMTRACLSAVFDDGIGRRTLLWSPPGKMGDVFCSMSRSSCAMRRPFCSPRTWTPRFKPMKKKLSLVPPMCHGDMEIVSVKELADGSLHFTFGTPSEGINNVDELSSINGEHLAGKLPNPGRRPSRFRKRSPVPVMAARRRKKQVEGPSTEKASDGATRKSSEGSVLSRPKSTFVKRSPIPSGKVPRSGDIISEARRSSISNVNHPDHFPGFKKQLHEEGRQGKSNELSDFVSQKRREAMPEKETETSDGRPFRPSNGSSDSSVGLLGQQPAVQYPRPRSKFYKRSPITAVGSQTAQKSSSSESVRELSQRQTVPSLTDDANFQIGLGDAKEAERNLDETRDVMKASDSDSPSEVPAHTDLRKYKLLELKSIAKSRGLKGYSKLKKDELLDLLEKT